MALREDSFMTHRFSATGKIIAEGTSKGVLRGKAGVIARADVIAAVLAARSPLPV